MKKVYEKPLFKRVWVMDFFFLIMEEGGRKVLRRICTGCHACHGCR